MQNNKCKNCGGSLIFSPVDQCLKCSKCGTKVVIPEGKEIVFHDLLERIPSNDLSWSNDFYTVRCEDCGANVDINEGEFINYCSYCGSQNLVDIKKIAKLYPDAVVPFAFDKEQAKNYYKNWLNKKHFLPKVLKKQTPNLKIDSNYFSAFVFNGEVKASYSGVLEYTSRDSDGDRRTHRRNVKGEINHVFIDHIVECSKNLTQQELSKITPFNLTLAKEYNGGYLLGSSAEFTDKTVEDASKDFEIYLKNAITARILSKHHCDRVVKLDLNLSYLDKKYTYCLLPNYVLNYDYKNKHYVNLMNGQTGKLSGSVPRSGVKITIFVLFMILLVGGLGILIYLL